MSDTHIAKKQKTKSTHPLTVTIKFMDGTTTTESREPANDFKEFADDVHDVVRKLPRISGVPPALFAEGSEDPLKAFPDVSSITVFALPDPTWEQRKVEIKKGLPLFIIETNDSWQESLISHVVRV